MHTHRSIRWMTTAPWLPGQSCSSHLLKSLAQVTCSSHLLKSLAQVTPNCVWPNLKWLSANSKLEKSLLFFFHGWLTSLHSRLSLFLSGRAVQAFYQIILSFVLLEHCNRVEGLLQLCKYATGTGARVRARACVALSANPSATALKILANPR